MKDHYYISPISGRIITSSKTTYKNLKQRRFIIDKDACLYDISSAKRCLKQLTKRYPDIISSTSFNSIPSKQHISAFTKDKQNQLNGFLKRDGKVYKFKKPIAHYSSSTPIVITLNRQHNKILEKKINESKHVFQNRFDTLHFKDSFEHKIVYNPVQDDFVHVPKKFDEHDINKVINIFNKELLPKTLPTIASTNISGIMEYGKKLIGYVQSDNSVKRFDTPLEINIIESKDHRNAPKTDSSQQTFDKITGKISDKITGKTSDDVAGPIDDNFSMVKELYDKIPKLKIDKKHLYSISEATLEDKASFLNNLEVICRDGEKLDNLTGKCFKCDYYNLEWDEKLRKCKMQEKIVPTIVEDITGNIIGYL